MAVNVHESQILSRWTASLESLFLLGNAGFLPDLNQVKAWP
jgi:hypothetical protein